MVPRQMLLCACYTNGHYNRQAECHEASTHACQRLFTAQIVQRSHRALLVSSLLMVMVVAPDFLPSLHDE